MAVRRATAADAAELTRLRGVMYEAWGADISDPVWSAECERVIRERLRQTPESFVAYVVDDSATAGRLVACGVGWIEHHLPGPMNLTGRRGHIASMSTDPEHRRRGHARAVFEALLGWFDERGLVRVDLRATAMGEPLYRAYGFGEPGGLPLTRAAEGTRMTWGRGH